jgi:Ca-activated chloride channel family protein
MRALLSIILIPLLIAGGTSPKEKVTIHGTVTDQSGRPIVGASVVAPELHVSVVTDAAGKFTMTVEVDRLTDSVLVRIRAIGFAPQTRKIGFSVGDDARSDFTLIEDVNRLESVVMTGVTGAYSQVYSGRVSASAVSASPVSVGSPAYSVSSGNKSWPGRIRRQREPSNTESYALIEDNPFLLTKERPLSTFSVDVDRASYSNVRRFINGGTRPPKDAVRIEEMINYFPYEYPAPDGDAPVSITTRVGRAPWNPSHQLVLIGLKARPIPTASLPPNNLVFLIDVSGSMDMPDKLPLVKSSFELLVNQLRPQDRVAIVAYAGNAGLVLPSTSGSNKEAILDAITRLEAGGSTAGGAGLRLAYDIATRYFMREGNNRVILATDGDFNVGVSSDAEMVRLIEDRRASGVFLSVLGFGTGNLKDSKMEQLADHGNGHYAYVDNLLEAKKVFVRELGATLRTVAKDVKLQIEFNPARTVAYRLIGYENRLLNDADFENDAKDAGDMGAGHTVTALYEVIPPGESSDSLLPAGSSLRYDVVADLAIVKVSGASQRDETGRDSELLQVKLRYKEPESSKSNLVTRIVSSAPTGANADFDFASAVAEFGLLLRDSKYRGSATFDAVARLAQKNLGADRDGMRQEFISLVRRASELSADVSMKER